MLMDIITCLICTNQGCWKFVLIVKFIELKSCLNTTMDRSVQKCIQSLPLADFNFEYAADIWGRFLMEDYL